MAAVIKTWGGMAASLLLAACLPIPTPPHDIGPAPDRTAASKLQIGVSKRADVLLILGEPRHRLEEDRFLMYKWDVAYGYILIGGGGGGAAFPASAPHFLCFEFGADGRLLRQSTLSGTLFSQSDKKAISACMQPTEAVDGK